MSSVWRGRASFLYCLYGLMRTIIKTAYKILGCVEMIARQVLQEEFQVDEAELNCCVS